MTDPKDYAIDLIKHYVLRGDSLDSLKKSYMGRGGGGYSASIAGNAWDKEGKLIHQGKTDEVVVTEIDGQDCCYVFKLEKLYNEILSGQMKLI